LSGAAGGLLLIIDPSGNLINMPLRWLSGSPFANYLMPGLFLFAMLGLFPLIVFFGLLIRHKHSWLASLFIGSTLILWIFIEIIIIGFQIQPPLQIIYGSLGILIIALRLRPSLRVFLNRSRTNPDQEGI
jgi:glucan phosphoethanolaminetransferase (alkaline phosphatase superfamily)